ncbi:hypothetical protein HK097_005676 [Rhizophlyctis rosea]|uniref:Uncharacterized protein n=1 Tax=Rhizophlyctis rosea TaxID=64517 RepID=A0AAD5SGJ7_9FUNG|nr:hypothetical protein HK097_005676 [Rhizophlyctis rosea]
MRNIADVDGGEEDGGKDEEDNDGYEANSVEIENEGHQGKTDAESPGSDENGIATATTREDFGEWIAANDPPIDVDRDGHSDS